ncbi:hypothetical protein MUP32_06915 [Candidatus Microgenomates bacterium]|nr:hypothetical protein [Candidatus Microgenomates bacterium]
MEFLRSLRISRIAVKRLKRDFKFFSQYSSLNPPKTNQSFHSFFSIHYLNQFQKWFQKKTRQPKKAALFIEVLNKFHRYLEQKSNSYLTQLQTKSDFEPLIIEYLLDLKKNHSSSATVRNYKADLIQFFRFLSINNHSLLSFADVAFDREIFLSFGEYM